MQFSYNVLNLPETVTKSDGSCSLTYTYLSDGTKVRAKVDGGFGSGLLGIDLAKIDFGARFYDPYTARWTTPDPLASKYSSVSPYTYCANDPVNKFDPDGKIVGTLLDIASVVMDTKSLVPNIKQGKVGASIVDGGSLTVDVIAAAIPVVPAGAGIAVKAAHTGDRVIDGSKVVDKVADASTGILDHTARGRASEKRVLEDIGMTKNTRKVSGYSSAGEKNTIPDGLEPNRMVEVKDTKEVYNTTQIQAQRDYAKNNNMKYELYVGTHTHVSGRIPEEYILRRNDLGPQK